MALVTYIFVTLAVWLSLACTSLQYSTYPFVNLKVETKNGMDLFLFLQPFICNEMNINGVHPVYTGIGHCVELIVEQEMPSTFAAFRMSGLAVSHVRMYSISSHLMKLVLLGNCTLD